MRTVLFFTDVHADVHALEYVGVCERVASLGGRVIEIESARTGRSAAEFIAHWQPDGLIVECGHLAEQLNLHAYGHLPKVFIDPKVTPSKAKTLHIVKQDAAAISAAAFHELAATHPAAYAFVRWCGNQIWSNERETAFCELARQAGRECRTYGDVWSRTDFLSFQRSLTNWLRTLPRPCAIFAANDRVAESVLRETRELALRCPDDVAVLGADDYAPVCEKTEPMLSSVRPDFQRGGELAALMLSAIITYGKNRYRGSHVRRYGTIGITHRDSTRVYDSSIDGESRAALDLIRREACNGLTAETVLGCYSCTRGPAAQRFRRATGRSILEEIHAVQLDRVKMMLGNKNQQLSSISDFCGFSSPHALRLFFLRETGMTMSEWRRRHT